MPSINRRLLLTRHREIRFLATLIFITLVFVQVSLGLRLSRLNDVTLSKSNAQTQTIDLIRQDEKQDASSAEEERLITPSVSDGTLQGKENCGKCLAPVMLQRYMQNIGTQYLSGTLY